MKKFIEGNDFKVMNVGVALDEGEKLRLALFLSLYVLYFINMMAFYEIESVELYRCLIACIFI